MFESFTHRQYHQAVGEFLCDNFGDVFPVEDSPAFYVPSGSSMVTVSVWPAPNSEAIIDIRAIVTKGSRIDAELLEMLMRANARIDGFGAYALEDDGTISYGGRMIASQTNSDGLGLLVVATAVAADDQDDIIVGTWGGKRVIDVFNEIERRLDERKVPLGFCAPAKKQTD